MILELNTASRAWRIWHYFRHQEMKLLEPRYPAFTSEKHSNNIRLLPFTMIIYLSIESSRKIFQCRWLNLRNAYCTALTVSGQATRLEHEHESRRQLLQIRANAPLNFADRTIMTQVEFKEALISKVETQYRYENAKITLASLSGSVIFWDMRFSADRRTGIHDHA